MSVLNRQVNPSKPRDKNDFYPTKPNFAFAHAMLALQNLSPYYDKHTILDLGIGYGVYGASLDKIRDVDNHDYNVNGIEINQELFTESFAEEHPYYNTVYWCDFLTVTEEKVGKYDLIIGNPPYKNIIQFVKKATEITKRGGIISFLVKTSFLESKERFEFFKVFRPNTIYFLANRPIHKHVESYCIVEFYNDYYDGWNKSSGNTNCEWVYVIENGYQVL